MTGWISAFFLCLHCSAATGDKLGVPECGQDLGHVLGDELAVLQDLLKPGDLVAGTELEVRCQNPRRHEHLRERGQQHTVLRSRGPASNSHMTPLATPRSTTSHSLGPGAQN